MDRRRFLASLAALVTMKPKNNWAMPQWGQARPIPIRTQEIYPVVHRGMLYVAGGIASRVGVPYFSNACYRYSPSDDRWTTVASLPEARHHAALVSTRGRLFQVGGFRGSYTHIWHMRGTVLELTDEGWQERRALPEPQAEGVLAARSDGTIHLVTGQSPKGAANRKRGDHLEVDTHLVWTLDGGWETAAPIPTPRNSATGGWVGDQLIVTGGRTRGGNMAVTEIYDGKEDRWRNAAPMPLPQAGTASVIVDKGDVEEGIIVFGGEIFTPQERVFPNVWRYALGTDRWSALPDLPTPRHGLGAGLIDGQAYVVGGATSPGALGTSDVNEILTI